LRQTRGLERFIADAHRDERAALSMDVLLEQLRHSGNDRHRQLVLKCEFEPFLGGFRGPDRLEQRVDFLGPGEAVGVQREAGLFRQIWHSQHGADAAPLAGGDDGDSDQALFGFVDADGVVPPETVDARAFARAAGIPGHRGFVFRDVDGGFM
jgi:hypothetical protein